MLHHWSRHPCRRGRRRSMGSLPPSTRASTYLPSHELHLWWSPIPAFGSWQVVVCHPPDPPGRFPLRSFPLLRSNPTRKWQTLGGGRLPRRRRRYRPLDRGNIPWDQTSHSCRRCRRRPCGDVTRGEGASGTDDDDGHDRPTRNHRPWKDRQKKGQIVTCLDGSVWNNREDRTGCASVVVAEVGVVDSCDAARMMKQ